MRAFSITAVASSLLLAVTAIAGPGGAKDKGKAKGKAGVAATGSAAGSGSGSGAGSGGAGSGAPDPGASGGSSSADTGPGMGSGSGSATDFKTVKPEDMPTGVRVRRLEQNVQALKEKAWQLKARVQMLKEQMVGGGVGAQALIAHANDMGSSFRLVKLVYTLDGAQIFDRSDDGGETLYKTKSFDVFDGPISPGRHTMLAVATYKGHGYGVFEYLSKYTFTAREQKVFTVDEGKIARVDCKAHERTGGVAMEKRATIECKIAEMAPEKAAQPNQTTPGTTPMPTPATPAPTTPAPTTPAPAPRK